MKCLFCGCTVIDPGKFCSAACAMRFERSHGHVLVIELLENAVISVISNVGPTSPRDIEHRLSGLTVRIAVERLVDSGRLIVDNDLKLALPKEKT